MKLKRVTPKSFQQPVNLGPGEILEIAGRIPGKITIHARGEASNLAIIRPSLGEEQPSCAGIVLLDPEHVKVQDLKILAQPTEDGVLVWATQPSEGIYLERLDISGARNGIAVGTDRKEGLHDVVIDSCLVQSCVLQGITSFGPQAPEFGLYAVTVKKCRVVGTTGDPSLMDNHSGSGIVLGSVSGGEISDCVARHNGAQCKANEGPEGIFIYDCDDVHIVNCIASENRTGGPADGGGLGIDLRCTNCSIENCEAHNNDGAGILIWNLPGMLGGGHQIHGNILSNNCSSTRWQGEITVAPSSGATRIINNSLDVQTAAAAILHGANASNLELNGNLYLNNLAPKVVEGQIPMH